MNIEKFHNELAMRLGCERIVKDKRIQISVEESDDPVVTLKFQNREDIRFKASDNVDYVDMKVFPEIQDEMKIIIGAVCHAYEKACGSLFL